MSEHLRVWYSELRESYIVDTGQNRPSHYIKDANRVARVLLSLYRSGKYEFRPFLGDYLGLVATRKEQDKREQWQTICLK